MKQIALILAVAAIAAPGIVRAQSVSIDPPAEPIAVSDSTLSATLTAAPSSVSAGDTISYTLTTKNSTGTAVSGIGASVDLPVGFSFAAGSSAKELRQLGSLAPGASAITKFSLVVSSQAPGGRIPLEMIVSGTGVASLETTAVVEIRAGEVLGSEIELAATGVHLFVWLTATLFGLVVLLSGILLFRQTRRSV